MFAYRAVILACLFLFVDDDRGTVSLARAATEERHTTVGYNGDAAHESPISHSPSVTFEDADGRQVCEGTLVTPLLVLTAASCVDDSVTGFDPSQLSVVIATVDDSASTAIGKGTLPLHRNDRRARFVFQRPESASLGSRPMRHTGRGGGTRHSTMLPLSN